MRQAIVTFVLTTMVTSLCLAQAPASNLLAYYALDGNANDGSGNGNNGTTNGGVTWTADRLGRANHAASFDGVNGYIIIPNSTSLQSPTNALTIAGWINISSFPGIAAAGIVHKTNSSAYGQYGFNYQAWNAPHRFGAILGNSGAVGSCDLQHGRWYHVAFAWDGTTVVFYVDGINIGSTPLSGTLTPDGNPLTIGLDSPGQTEFLQGKLDEIRIYGRALSESEIGALYDIARVPVAQEFFDDFRYSGITDGNFTTRWNIGLDPPENTAITFTPNPECSDDKLAVLSVSMALGQKPEVALETEDCQFRDGTYAARVYWSDPPLLSENPSIHSFFTYKGAAACVPNHSECDFEYYSNGDNGSDPARLDYVTWRQQPPPPDPCAIRMYTPEPGNFQGWHTLLIHMDAGTVSYFVDGVLKSVHTKATDGATPIYPLQFMKIMFRNGSAATNLGPAETISDTVDWVYFANNQILSTEEVEGIVSALRMESGKPVNTVPIPLAASTTRTVSGPGTLNFNEPGSTTGTTIDLATVTGTGFITVERYITTPIYPAFSGVTPAELSDCRWVIMQMGLSSISAEIKIDISTLSSEITNPSLVTIYRRSVEGNGPFVALPTSYNATSHELTANVTGFSEFILGTDFVTRQVEMNAGWNMISVPLAVPDFRKGTLYPAAISQAFSYGAGYVPKDTLDNGYGYWLKFPSVQNATLSGFAFGADTILVTSGWNMVGSISTPVPVNQVLSNPPGLMVSPFYGYTTGYAAVNSIEPHRGYWVKVQQDGQLILNASGGSNGTVQIVETKEMPPDPPFLTGVAKEEIPTVFALDQNYPNPFNPSTTIRYSLPGHSHVELIVFNALGQQVKVLQNGDQEAGYHAVTFDGNGLSSGAYFYRLRAAEYIQTRQLFLLK